MFIKHNDFRKQVTFISSISIHISSISIDFHILCSNIDSPLDFLHFYIIVWKFYGIFEIDTNSQLLKQISNSLIVLYQCACCYLGPCVQTMALIGSQSIKETMQIIFITFAYFNAGVKTFIISRNRKTVEKLWHRLNGEDFKAKNHSEREYIDCFYFFQPSSICFFLEQLEKRNFKT